MLPGLYPTIKEFRISLLGLVVRDATGIETEFIIPVVFIDVVFATTSTQNGILNLKIYQFHFRSRIFFFHHYFPQ